VWRQTDVIHLRTSKMFKLHFFSEQHWRCHTSMTTQTGLRRLSFVVKLPSFLLSCHACRLFKVIDGALCLVPTAQPWQTSGEPELPSIIHRLVQTLSLDLQSSAWTLLRCSLIIALLLITGKIPDMNLGQICRWQRWWSPCEGCN